MSESTRWLLYMFLWIDLFALVLTGVFMHVYFPRRIRDAIRKNVLRLDGTISKRRRAIERSDYAEVMVNCLGAVTVLLLAINALLFVVHTCIVPIQFGAHAISEFDLDQSSWSSRLRDPEHGDLASQFQEWQDDNGTRLGLSLYGLVITWPVLVVVVLVLFFATVLAMCDRYVTYLRFYEARIAERYQKYFVHDMQRRHDLVERQMQS